MIYRNDQTGLLLVSHGTRSPIGTAQFHALAENVARRLAPASVEAAFLELQQPDIGAGIERLARGGVRRLTVMPLLLFAAEHVLRDIPDMIQAALARLEAFGIEAVQASHLGCHPAIVELSRRRFEHAVTGMLQVPARDCCLLIVGRGSHDESATAEMYELARLRQQAASETPIEVAFLAMAQPLLHEQLLRIAARGHRRVIVQPHLLFHGELAESIAPKVAAVAQAHPQQEWLDAPLLADPLDQPDCGTKMLANVILDRCRETSIHVVGAAAGS